MSTSLTQVTNHNKQDSSYYYYYLILFIGIDTAHVEFSPISGVNRQVTNIYNVYGSVTGNTDGNGHGTHCAGKHYFA